MPKHAAAKTSKFCIFNGIEGDQRRGRSHILSLLADLSRCGGFQPTPPRSVRKVPIWGQPPSAVQSSEARPGFFAWALSQLLTCTPRKGAPFLASLARSGDLPFRHQSQRTAPRTSRAETTRLSRQTSAKTKPSPLR
jgi:hypothetical protein